MDGPRGYYAMWNKLNGERQILYDFTHMWNLKNKTKNKKKQTETDSYTQRTNWGLPEGRVGGWVKNVKGIKRYKLPDIK